MTRFEPGAELEPLVIERVEPGPMKVVAVLQEDPNPIHWDAGAVDRRGLGDRVVNQGPITASWLLRLAAREAGGAAGVEELRTRFRGNVFAGDRVVCSGQVKSLDSACGTVELELDARVDGRLVATATARIRPTLAFE